MRIQLTDLPGIALSKIPCPFDDILYIGKTDDWELLKGYNFPEYIMVTKWAPMPYLGIMVWGFPDYKDDWYSNPRELALVKELLGRITE